MRLDDLHNPNVSEICSEFPLAAIEDDSSYQAAIEILDRLFALDDRKTPAEFQYFHALAQLAYEYEMKK